MRILKIAPLLALCVSLVTVASASAAVEPKCPVGSHFVFNPELGSGRCVAEGNWYTNGKIVPEQPAFLEGTAKLQDQTFGEYNCEVLADVKLSGANATLSYLADEPCVGGQKLETNPAYLSAAPPPTVVCGNESNPCNNPIAKRGGLPPTIGLQPVFVSKEFVGNEVYFLSTKEVQLWVEVPSKNLIFGVHGILAFHEINGQKSGLFASHLDFVSEEIPGVPMLEGPLAKDFLHGADLLGGRQMQLEQWK